jgi:hypothetical protein
VTWARCFIGRSVDPAMTASSRHCVTGTILMVRISRSLPSVRTGNGDAPMRTRRADRKTDGVADLIDTDAHLCRV